LNEMLPFKITYIISSVVYVTFQSYNGLTDRTRVSDYLIFKFQPIWSQTAAAPKGYASGKAETRGREGRGGSWGLICVPHIHYLLY
jgi:hypothetical protein